MNASAGTQGGAQREAQRLAEWLRLEGLPASFPLDIHPRDEMLAGVAVPSRLRPGRERLMYLRQGQEAALVLEHALQAAGRALSETPRLLELPSGYGRVTRHLLPALGASRLTACEIVPEAVAHVGQRFGIPCFASRADPAQVAWPGRFDVIFVASLFSHLPRPSFERWLAQLRHVLADDGLLVLSTHGLWMPQAPPADAQGFAFRPDSESLTLAGHEYGTAFVAPQEVERLARAAGFAGVRLRERELWSLQDVFVLSASPLRTEPVAWRPAPVLDGAIDGIETKAAGSRSAPREIWLHGWAECRDPDQPVERVTLHLGRDVVAPVTLHPPRRELRPPPQPARRVITEWHHHAALPPALTGRATLALVAETATQRRCVDVRTLDLDTLRFVDGEAG